MRDGKDSTRLEKIAADGEVHLASSDQAVIETAGLAKSRPETFVYATGDGLEQVTGTVISSYRDGGELHFSVRPEIPGAHAI
jgi:hypothetical protein